jgi:hypothetical protein
VYSKLLYYFFFCTVTVPCQFCHTGAGALGLTLGYRSLIQLRFTIPGCTLSEAVILAESLGQESGPGPNQALSHKEWRNVRVFHWAVVVFPLVRFAFGRA